MPLNLNLVAAGELPCCGVSGRYKNKDLANSLSTRMASRSKENCCVWRVGIGNFLCERNKSLQEEEEQRKFIFALIRLSLAVMHNSKNWQRYNTILCWYDLRPNIELAKKLECAIIYANITICSYMLKAGSQTIRTVMTQKHLSFLCIIYLRW